LIAVQLLPPVMEVCLCIPLCPGKLQEEVILAPSLQEIVVVIQKAGVTQIEKNLMKSIVEYILSHCQFFTCV